MLIGVKETNNIEVSSLASFKNDQSRLGIALSPDSTQWCTLRVNAEGYVPVSASRQIRATDPQRVIFILDLGQAARADSETKSGSAVCSAPPIREYYRFICAGYGLFAGSAEVLLRLLSRLHAKRFSDPIHY